jgi:hypothetical protein
MGRDGPTVAWAHKMSRGIRASLQELTHFLAVRSDLSDVCALYADMRVSGPDHATRAARSMGRYGFEAASACVDRRPLPQRMADALFVLMMAGVTNPCSLRRARMRHANVRLYISRRVLEQRYAVRRPYRVKSSEPPGVNSAAGEHPAASPEPQPPANTGLMSRLRAIDSD